MKTLNLDLISFSFQFLYEERYIDLPSNRHWYDLYKYDIPVIHLNQRYLMKHKVDEELLKKALIPTD